MKSLVLVTLLAFALSSNAHEFHEFGFDCEDIFIELGCGDTSDIRKLYEPTLFQNSKVVELFDRIFGKQRKHVCSIIFESNPANLDYLSQLETSYNAAGFHVKTFPYAIRHEVKEVLYGCDSHFKDGAWPAYCDFTVPGLQNVTVKAIDFVKFFTSQFVERMNFDLKTARIVVRSNIGDGQDNPIWMHLMIQEIACKFKYAYGSFVSPQVQEMILTFSKPHDCSFKYLHIIDVDSPTTTAVPLPLPESLREIDVDLAADAIFNTPIPQPPFKLTACIIAYQEGRYLLEWIWYHYLVGFQHFFIYDNNSTDHTEQILEHLVRRGLVTYIPWIITDGDQQGKALRSCFNASEPKGTWTLMFDADEYVVVAGQVPSVAAIRHQEPFILHQHLDRWKLQGVGSVLVSRLEFDTNGHIDPPPGLVMREYTSAARPNVFGPMEYRGKPLALFEAVLSPDSAHDFVLQPGFQKSNGNDFIISTNPTVNRYEPIHLHHYVARSFNECKMKRLYNLRMHAGVYGWRNSSDICDRFTVGKPGYDPIAHFNLTYMVDMLFADVVERLMARLRS